MQQRTSIPRLVGATVLAASLTATSARADDDFQTWQTVSLKWLDTRYVDLTTAVHTRFTDDSSALSLWRVGHAVSTDPLPWLRAGVAYRYTEGKPPAGDWRHQHRGEFQLTHDRFDFQTRRRHRPVSAGHGAADRRTEGVCRRRAAALRWCGSPAHRSRPSPPARWSRRWCSPPAPRR
jgi:hypothetical protein